MKTQLHKSYIPQIYISSDMPAQSVLDIRLEKMRKKIKFLKKNGLKVLSAQVVFDEQTFPAWKDCKIRIKIKRTKFNPKEIYGLDPKIKSIHGVPYTENEYYLFFTK